MRRTRRRPSLGAIPWVHIRFRFRFSLESQKAACPFGARRLGKGGGPRRRGLGRSGAVDLGDTYAGGGEKLPRMARTANPISKPRTIPRDGNSFPTFLVSTAKPCVGLGCTEDLKETGMF